MKIMWKKVEIIMHKTGLVVVWVASSDESIQ